MKAEIVAVGTELLMGETQDTNSSWLGTRLPELGLELEWVTIVGDDLGRLTEALDRAWRRSAVIITIGGLGPTLDDMTRDAIAKMLGERMTVAPELKTWLEESFSRRNIRPMPQSNLRQARVIPSSTSILNAMGTAPSWWIERDGKILVTLPGPPRELANMWTTEIAPRLKERIPGQAIVSRTFKTIGLSEAALDELIRHVYDIPGMDLGVYTKPDGIHVRAIAKAPEEAEAVKVLEHAEAEIRAALGEYIWGTGEEVPPEKVGELLRERSYTLAVLESCTGGMLGAAITDVPGSSDYFVGGAIAYSNDVKLMAGVPAEVMDGSGVVSAETAQAMAEAARTTYGTDCGIGVTGVAGPGDSGGIKAGTVFIGVAVPGSSAAEQYSFPSRRPLVRGRAVTAALLQLTRALQQGQGHSP
ncbi:MAG: competence/damage-inducible protein A [Chloroflexi bacterium]|nr:competence/damage-inducible protein A [Chloroflexota bacterium]